ncbi:MAG: HAD family hydrolase [Planctomycetaceae bacterium]
MAVLENIPTAAEPIRAVAFDLDGLMFNTEDIFELMGVELLRRRGKALTDELRVAMMGRRAHEAFAVMIEMLELSETVDALRDESSLIFHSHFEAHLAPMPGLFELLAQIELRHIPKAVATSSHREYLDDLLGRFNLRERFHVTLAAEDVTHGKPHPEIYLKTAERLGVDPRAMLVLEDSQAGTQAAAAAGAVAVAVPSRHSSGHDFAPAKFLAERLDDRRILALLGESDP